MSFISIQAEWISAFSLSAQQNSYPLLKRGVITANPVSDKEVSTFVRNIRVTLTSEPEMFEAEEWVFDQIDSGQTIRLQERAMHPYYDKLNSLSEELQVTLSFNVSYEQSDCNVESFQTHVRIPFLPADYWGGETRQPDLLAAFVQPNTTAVEQITATVAQLLRKSGQESAVNGYQSNTRERPYLFGSALWSVLFNERLVYVSPPVGWADYGQRIRSVSDIQKNKLGACLDTSLLFASCLENMGLNPVIALTKEHAFAGFWLVDDCFPVLTNDDAMDLRKRIAVSDLVMFETTLITNDAPVSFREAEARAKDLLAEEYENEFVMLIDVKQARARQVKPLGVVEVVIEGAVEGETDGIKIPLGTVPVLPPVRVDDRVIPETPETRVDMWQRKLLDLTKRNPLLNVKTSAMRVFCPDLSSLEDELAGGKSFKFIAAENSPLNDSGRDAGAFLMKTGQNLHVQYALEQLNQKILVANEPSRRLDTKLVELLRKAKNDLEEGGSNTLYLALGMLRWKETPDADRSYRAPLILLPAKLERKSAQAPIYLRQLPDEEPIFNLTLIEFLQTDYAVNLDVLRHDLPEDDSGVDVKGIWVIVREAIKEQPGFEVVEEVVLGSFSFAKYLMWKDLRDRVDVLKQSPFVEHLVDRPSDAYKQESSFIDRDKVDDRIQPEDFFAPLNCDSSQMVAVEASSRSQDFVLEGPPGTGKSETITNIICHNLALGRKVLFVAEKMAALQVVYRRMEKVKLSHLCLELHSSKANKKGVLEQLSKSWTHRELASQTDWLDQAKKLKGIRHHLNDYVRELHKHGELGFSPRDAIARVVRYEKEHPLRLDWPNNLSQAVIQQENEVDGYLSVAKDLGIAFSEVLDVEVDHFSIVDQTEWSNEWRADAVTMAGGVVTSIKRFKSALDQVFSILEINAPVITLNIGKQLAVLDELCDAAMGDELDFALNSGAPKRMAALAEVSQQLTRLEQEIADFGHGLKWEMLNDLPLEEWIIQCNEASGLFGFLKRGAIRKAAMAKGLVKIKDLSILDLALEARETLHKIYEYAPAIDGASVWKGVGTDAVNLMAKIECGEKARTLFNQFVGCFDDPVEPAAKLRRTLVDGRDFLNESARLVVAAKECKRAFEELQSALIAAEGLKICPDRNEELDTVMAKFFSISSYSEKLNRWCRWLAAKQLAESNGLGVLAKALEDKVLDHDMAESNALTGLCIWLAPLLIDSSQTLVQFAGANHESLIKTFRDLDQEVSETSAKYIAAKVAGNLPDKNAKEAPPEYGVLARELTKKSRHKPVRWLVQEMGGSLTDLTPCFMMSPLSVAQFLPADFSMFDLVVFDEASQITTWDAVGAIARGANVIVVGDPKQMPPSNNFGRTDVDDPDEADMESILDQALAARLPHLRLTGHYRSRHETLIAFSNSHYYENSLMTFPSAETKESAVSLHRVDGVYAKGKSKTNVIEAKAVVNAVVARLEGMIAGEPIKSIGIVTINSQQQRFVEDLMDEARRGNPTLEPFFTATDKYDPIFIKNLESVQGDERDIIVLSLTYGPTEAGGRTMSMNFGPLNKEGGERRLNVAVTRATTEVIVFSSFDASMIDLSRTQATAIEHLKNYIEFAERGPVALAEYSHANYGVDQFDSDFEQGVASALRAKGWKVQTQVGVSKFRVDLGVIHPDHPGKYLAGIECDGATYHSSPSARDRDRVRQVILENLGWRILRLWSTDYFQDPEYAMRKLFEQLDSILKVDRDTAEPSEDQEDIDEVTDMDRLVGAVTEKTNDESGSATELYDQNVSAGLDIPTTRELSILPVYDKESLFIDSHRDNISDLARQILSIKSGITLNELSQDIARQHGLKKTSRKQLKYLFEVIREWVGITRDGVHRPTVWLQPEDVVDEISWRGLSPFGEERNWKDLAHPEQIGFARAALQAQPSDPIDWMFKELQLLRRHETALTVFQEWLDHVQQSKLEIELE